MEVPVELIAKFKQEMIESYSKNLGKEYGNEKFDSYKDTYRAIGVIVSLYNEANGKLPSKEEVVYVLQNSFEHLYILTQTYMEDIDHNYKFHIDVRTGN